MARISKARLEELLDWRKELPEEEWPGRKECSELAKDLVDARAESEHLRKALQQCIGELARMEEITKSVRRNAERAALHHKCQAPGCEDYAVPGSKICNKHAEDAEEGRLGDLCLVRGCREERRGRYSIACSDHHWDAKHASEHTDEDFMAVISRGQRVISKPVSVWDRDLNHSDDDINYTIRLVSAGSVNETAPLRRVMGPPEPVPGFGLEMTTHGLPAAIAPEPFEDELTRATGDLQQGEHQSNGEAPPAEEVTLRCVYGQCTQPRQTGHAFCAEHLTGL